MVYRTFTNMKKKRFVIPILFIVAVVVGAGLSSNKDEFDLTASVLSTEGQDLLYHVPNEKEVSPQFYFSDYENSLFLGKSYIGFKEALGFKESRGQYEIVNPYGYLGKYQFSANTLRMMGFKNLDDFLKNTKKQEDAFNAYIAFNKWVLRNEIRKFDGKFVGGVKVTESGLLAAAHLAGPGNVKKYLQSNGASDVSDANGTTVKYYLKQFSGYDTSHIEATKKPQLF